MLNLITKNILPLVRSHLSDQENSWLSVGLSTIDDSNDVVNDLLNVSVSVKRKLITQVKVNELPHCTPSEIIRILLIIDAQASHANMPTSQLLKEYYQYGDSQEKCAVVKGLFLLDPDGHAVNTAVRASRCNSVDEFAALALQNPYPSTHFEDLNFNQLVLKALHQRLDINKMFGLQDRLNDDLVNMTFSYIVEQALAERIPPASIWLAIRYQALNAEHKALFSRYSQHFAVRDQAHKASIESLIESQAIDDVKI